MKEYDQIYTCESSFSVLNEHGFMKPYGYQAMMNSVAEEHLQNIHCSIDDLEKHGMAWVLLSASYEIAIPVNGIIKLKASTWHSKQSGITFRRDFRFTDEMGTLYFNAATFSVLFDINKRKILKPNELPFELPAPTNNITMEANLHYRNRSEMTVCDERRIYPSHIDRLGHTNNERYGEYIYDAFTPAEVENLGKLRRFDMHFINELCLGDRFSVRRGVDKNGIIIIDGVADNSQKESFVCQIKFEK